jgi:hypothetical protein
MVGLAHALEVEERRLPMVVVLILLIVAVLGWAVLAVRRLQTSRLFLYAALALGVLLVVLNFR